MFRHCPDPEPLMITCVFAMPRMARWKSSCFLALGVVLATTLSVCADEPRIHEAGRRVNIVLVGATSSLAKKYLWQSFFKAFLEEEAKNGTDVSYGFYGGATRQPTEGKPLLKDILESSTTCKGVKIVSPSACEGKLSEFKGMVQYVMLRDEGNYKDLGATLNADVMESGLTEGGRLFYLAIAPDLYPWVAESIDKHVRPPAHQPPAWLRVVFEKPFGRDLASAEVLAAELGRVLKEEEIYRVDHYMGKTVVQAILPFRHANAQALTDIWGGSHVESLEVAMKETEDCEGRTSFYEGYGVIRDVLQNHLTQVLVLLKMDLPPDASSSSVYGEHHHRTAVLKTLRLHGQDADAESSIHVGQYHGYHQHVATDRRQKEKGDSNASSTKVPTAAAVTLASADPKWAGVRLVFKAGKALDERSSYAKVTMRERREPGAPPCQLLFNIQGGELGSAIAWNRVACEGVLPELVAPPGWSKEERGDMWVVRALDDSPPNAYEVVVQEVLEGDRSMFLGTEELLQQWSAWDPVLLQADDKQPALYPAGFDIDEVEVTGWVATDEEEAAAAREEL